VIRRLVAAGWDRDACLNVNFPPRPADDVRGLKVTNQGAGTLQGVDIESGRDPRDIEYHWLKLTRAPRDDDADSETVALGEGYIAVTPLKFERTHDHALARLRANLG
jgi:5'-nucleotidase